MTTAQASGHGTFLIDATVRPPSPGPIIVRREKPLVTFTEEDRARSPRDRFSRIATRVFAVPKTEIEALAQRPRVRKPTKKR
jgi:hypothetical protein